MRFESTLSIFMEGKMTQLYIDVSNKKKIDRLKNEQLTCIATVLGKLSKEYDLYDLLFDQPPQVLEIDKIQVNTKDLMAFVLLDHTYTRGYFSKSAAARATSDTTNSQGVPLAFEGAKRLYNKSYMSWIPEDHSREELWKCDVFLPADLASLNLNGKEEVIPNPLYGLLTLFINNIDIPIEAINGIRQSITNWAVAHRPRLLEEPSSEHEKMYNKCSHKIRAMLLQGWIWQPICSNEAMIRNITDWDDFPPAIGFEGLTPSGECKPLGLTRFLGITPGNKDLKI